MGNFPSTLVAIVIAMLLALFLSLAGGCTLANTRKTFVCLHFSGPPPSGVTTVLTVPDDSTEKVSFDANCNPRTP